MDELKALVEEARACATKAYSGGMVDTSNMLTRLADALSASRDAAYCEGWNAAVDEAAEVARKDTRSQLAKDMAYKPAWFRHAEARAAAILSLRTP